jgi:hypothetical protein
MSIQGVRTQYGFQWGAAKIERACSDDKKGWVCMLLETPKTKLQIYVTKTGKVRVHDVSGRGARELKVPPE